MRQLRVNAQLRQLCGWRTISALPHESTFSRAFAEFAQSELPQRLHRALIEATQGTPLIGHISRDSTAIAARERFPRAEPAPTKPVGKRNYEKRSKRAKANDRGTFIKRQRYMPVEQILAQLPTQCAIGVKNPRKETSNTGAATNCIWMWPMVRFRSAPF